MSPWEDRALPEAEGTQAALVRCSTMATLPLPPHRSVLGFRSGKAVLRTVSQCFSVYSSASHVRTSRPEQIFERHKRRIDRIDQSISIRPLAFALLLPSDCLDH